MFTVPVTIGVAFAEAASAIAAIPPRSTVLKFNPVLIT
jgi:hypothetical protein